jgi:hypothetical protein
MNCRVIIPELLFTAFGVPLPESIQPERCEAALDPLPDLVVKSAESCGRQWQTGHLLLQASITFLALPDIQRKFSTSIISLML